MYAATRNLPPCLRGRTMNSYTNVRPTAAGGGGGARGCGVLIRPTVSTVGHVLLLETDRQRERDRVEERECTSVCVCGTVVVVGGTMHGIV